MKRTTKTEFFRRVKQLDINPQVDESTLKSRWHTSIWKTRNGTILGKTVSDSWGIEGTQFWLQ